MNLFTKATALLLATAAAVSASNVLVADDKNFQELVIDSGVPSLVEIYASWCGHCKKLAPVWEQLADAYAVDPKKGGKPKVQIVKIDGDINRKISKKYEVSGFPTIKWFGADGSVEDVNVGRDFEALSQFVSQKSGAAVRAPKKVPSAVVELTDSNFDKIAYDPKKTVIVAFTASWCGHCKTLKPEYALAADALRNEESVVVAQVDMTGEDIDQLKTKFNIRGYPTIFVFPAEEGLQDSDEEPSIYNGGRKAADFVSYLNEAAGLSRNVDGTLGPDAGRFRKFDAISHQFVDASKEVRATLLAKLTEGLEKLSAQEAASVIIYKRFAEKINGSGEYLNKEIKRLSNIISKGALKSSKLDELQIKLNILKTFVPGQKLKEETKKDAHAHGDKPKQAILKDEL